MQIGRLSFCEVRSFAERDIDIWLSEELRVNPTFSAWFCQQIGLPVDDIEHPAIRTRVSVMGENGETDVEALFRLKSGRIIAILIENKIEHSLKSDQVERYFDRGRYGVRYGHWDAFWIVVFAPQSKLEKYSSVIKNNPHVSFEQASSFLTSASKDDRGRYRAEFLLQAAVPSLLDVQGNDMFRAAFWQQLFKSVEQRFPGFFDIDPNDIPKTTYIAANCKGSPGYFRVDLKGHMGQVDLAFKNIGAGKLVAFLEENRPAESEVVFNKRSIALQIAGLPKFFVGDGIGAVESRALASYHAAHTLLSFWKANQSFFDEHYGVSGSASSEPGVSSQNESLKKAQPQR
jgi:hypothetical protein